MKKFLLNGARFFLFFIAVCVLLVTLYFRINKFTVSDLPALNFSDSYSFNEKIRFMGNKAKTQNIVAIGSSMTLNNLHSKTILKKLNTNDYLNTAAWGLTIEDNYKILKSLNKIYNIKYLILVSNMVDFQVPNKVIDYEFVENYLERDYLRLWLDFVKHFNLIYYKDNLAYAKKVRNSFREYEYLNYDKYGGVNYLKDKIIIDEKRWLFDFRNVANIQSQYYYLDSLSNYCKQNGIRLMFFQSPLRSGILYDKDVQKQNNLNTHIKKVKGIVEENGQLFIDSNEKIWADSLFIDSHHFNEKGAEIFTGYCLDRIISVSVANKKFN